MVTETAIKELQLAVKEILGIDCERIDDEIEENTNCGIRFILDKSVQKEGYRTVCEGMERSD